MTPTKTCPVCGEAIPLDLSTTPGRDPSGQPVLVVKIGSTDLHAHLWTHTDGESR